MDLILLEPSMCLPTNFSAHLLFSGHAFQCRFKLIWALSAKDLRSSLALADRKSSLSEALGARLKRPMD
ncbi:hypothetical protein TNCV_4209341 [Trichonephila clavipes]|nr:hypothetical protein TNCV_4209341 [Trichonephila clavipes]